MMTVSAVTGAPSFVTKYYEYATGKPGVECENPTFWNNANTFFNLGTYTMQICCEGFTLLPAIRKIPLRYRMIVGLLIPLGELLTLVLIPVFTIPSQNGAIAALMTVSIVDGFSKSLADSSTHALAGPFPTQFFNGEQWGLAICSLLMCIISVILKASMGNTFDDVNTQSRIYFVIAIVFQLLTILQFTLMISNPFAHKYVAEFRMLKGIPEPLESVELNEEYAGEFREHAEEEEEEEVIEKNLHPENSEDELEHGVNAVAIRVKGDADGMVDKDQHGTVTSSDQMLRANGCVVVKKVYPLLLSSFYCFFLTLTMWPGVYFNAYHGNSDWYTTLISLLFNLGDFTSRVILLVPKLRPPPMACLYGCAARTVFVPILVLCVRGIINNMGASYALCVIFGLSNGYFGAMSTVYCPRTPTLSTAGERMLAGIIAGLALECGLAVGANFAAILNGVIIPSTL